MGNITVLDLPMPPPEQRAEIARRARLIAEHLDAGYVIVAQHFMSNISPQKFVFVLYKSDTVTSPPAKPSPPDMTNEEIQTLYVELEAMRGQTEVSGFADPEALADAGRQIAGFIDPDGVQDSIVRISRGATKNSGSPMWRCLTAAGRRVNIFKHELPERDTYHLFRDKFHSDPIGAPFDLMDMLPGQVIAPEAWEISTVQQRVGWIPLAGGDDRPLGGIHVTLVQDGEWWKVAQVDNGIWERLTTIYDPSDDWRESQRQRAIEWATRMIDGNALIFDTETTGTDHEAEIVRIAVLRTNGKLVLDQYIRPEQVHKLMQPDEKGVMPADIHGITPEQLKDEPTFPDIYEAIRQALQGHHCIAYNASFDFRLLTQTRIRHDLPFIISRPDCAMLMFAQYVGEFNTYHMDYRVWSLRDACAMMGIVTGNLHDPVNDCKATLELIRAMSRGEEPRIDAAEADEE